MKKITISIVMALLCQKSGKPLLDKLSYSCSSLQNLSGSQIRLAYLKRYCAYGLIVFLLCTLSLVVNAQLVIDSIKPLRVGDHLSEEFWKAEHQMYDNAVYTKQNLSSYKGKLLVLDFWATWCGACVGNIPKLSKLQSEHAATFQIVLVNCYNTRDTERIIKRFYEQHKTMFSDKTIPTIVDDKYLLKLFPHRIIPHYVWIDAYGSVAAITTSPFLNSEQIKLMTK